MIVRASLWIACPCRPTERLWWDQVTEAPDVNKITLFNKGTPNGLNTAIPVGGQTLPTSIVGLNLLWKYLQKNDKKKKISEIINKIIPLRKPNSTTKEWEPKFLPSREISRHHWVTKINNIKSLNSKRCNSKKWNILTSPVTRPNPKIEAK